MCIYFIFGCPRSLLLQFFSSCEWGYSSCAGFLIGVASAGENAGSRAPGPVVAARGLVSCGSWALGAWAQ